MIPEHEKQRVREVFDKSLLNEVRLAVFTQEVECAYCKDTRELVVELSTLSPKIKAESYDLVRDSAKAQEYGVDKIPAIIIWGSKNYKIRFFGMPAGYEFGTLIEDITDASQGSTQLSEKTKIKLRNLNKPVHIQVFVTPTCPYCPKAVRLAHQLAIESDVVKADMIESIEFPHLAQKYNVMAVPKVVVNDTVEFVGALPEDAFVDRVINALTPNSKTSNPYV